MNDQFVIPQASVNEWLEELKPYQRETLKTVLADHTPEDAAKIWLSNIGSNSIISFGGLRDVEPFWDRFKAEFNKFICGDPSYAGERASLAVEGINLKTAAIAAIASAVGAAIGMAATLLVPVVVLMLCIVGKVGKNAYCAANIQGS